MHGSVASFKQPEQINCGTARIRAIGDVRVVLKNYVAINWNLKVARMGYMGKVPSHLLRRKMFNVISFLVEEALRACGLWDGIENYIGLFAYSEA